MTTQRYGDLELRFTPDLHGRGPARNAHWQIRTSPFYRIRRIRHFDVALFRDNRNGMVPQEQSETVTSGASREDSTTFSITTGITVGASLGIEVSAKPFGVGVAATTTYSVSATVELGYETRRNVTVMNQVARMYALTVPPRSSGCLWMEHHELVPVRADGSVLGPRASLGFRTDHYVTGEFPGGPAYAPSPGRTEANGHHCPTTSRPPSSPRPRPRPRRAIRPDRGAAPPVGVTPCSAHPAELTPKASVTSSGFIASSLVPVPTRRAPGGGHRDDHAESGGGPGPDPDRYGSDPGPEAGSRGSFAAGCAARWVRR
ncbi:hypothetical protein [Embleya scabrispora]|uniref:hypothetical protein n=1 Tax=Embleya scabrispora TaxID=159449 RepID=UPI00039F5E93|nr:hypothetical protein [Embleya scabrispora]MYS82096.1 hypothetical protein [Streptomyces sp. SID5474]